MKIDNRQVRLGDELKKELTLGSRVKIAAATFSMFAYQELKDELENIDSLQFIFTNPTFLTKDLTKEFREYAIPKCKREQSLFGASFEIKLMNDLSQKAIARECAEWIRQKVRFKSITEDVGISDGIRIEQSEDTITVDKLKEFDRKELGYEPHPLPTVRHLNHAPESLTYLTEFDEYWQNDEYFRDVTEKVLESLSTAYQEHSPEFIYYVMLYNIFKDFLLDINEDHQPNEHVKYKETKLWNTLYDFQKDAVESIITKLEQYQGCILADSVGLGKTYTALAVMTYYAYRGKRILVLCPKKLENNWNMYRHNYKNNPIYDRQLQYDVLYHTDLSRTRGMSNGIDLALNNWDTYDLVVIDESHNFRNGGGKSEETGKENRYSRLMNRVIKEGVPTKVLMLSATPVNNRFNDLKNQLALAYEGNPDNINHKLDTKSSIDDIFRMAQSAYNKWADFSVENRTTERLLEMLDFDFFKVLDSVTIARSRKHIRDFYDREAIGDFPQRLKPKNYYPELTVSLSHITYKRIYQLLDRLNLMIYQPSQYIYPSKRFKYEKKDGKGLNLSQSGREAGIKKLMMINLLKRLESSVQAFRYTLEEVVLAYIKTTLSTIESYELNGQAVSLKATTFDDNDFDIEDSNAESLVGKKVTIELQDIDYQSWKRDLEDDDKILSEISDLIAQIDPSQDQKLQSLRQLIDDKLANPINKGNKKIIIFSAFATTTDYLYREISSYVLKKYGLHTAQVSGGQTSFKTTLDTEHKDLNSLLTYFSPKSKSRHVVFPDDEREIDILIATDVISEGQNLQDADMMVNYDIHWNPVRIIQRFGRVDRIGSQNKVIQLVNFWPNIDLDEYIDLKSRVESRMKISVLTSTADDNVLSDEEIEDNNYRKKQLERLRNEVVDLEEMSDGISIMDLGLEDYRTDLNRYLKGHPELEKMPLGLQTVVPASSSLPEGAIFVLKNVKNQKEDRQNRLYPYYLVYVNSQGHSLYTVTETKKLLEVIRSLVKGKDKPLEDLVERYKAKTKDGVEMSYYSKRLQDAVNSLVEQEEISFVDSLFSAEELDLMTESSQGKDDFELICFFAVMEEGHD
ncbi:helicase-related protein [Streptococcus saliviloxodontae]|uniref:SNF2 family DNA or RNA helicase n=1 Tax=Streptococcus saliviloxodontae TaxID=1349416 RepID=A0ABS2PMH8_9STRE|nr:helicase-related protein [Streptococcus saliviloxodontae]MBM7636637.1 SNF2 family DNA or RNA helicase [Streptococcus saliviloxodontae]